MNRPVWNIETLLADDSFLQYCMGEEEATRHWEELQATDPALREIVSKARNMFEQLKAGLTDVQGEVARFRELFRAHVAGETGSREDRLAMQDLPAMTGRQAIPERPGISPKQDISPGPGMRGKYSLRRWMAAAAVFILVVSGYWLWHEKTTPEFATVSTHPGELKEIKLPDGSQVWLNGATILKYVQSFTNQRTIILEEGEAFFRVARDGEHPFVVQTASGLAVRDLGTAFSISSYKASSTEKVQVKEGQVAVQRQESIVKKLSMHEGISIQRKSGVASSFTADDASIDGWLQGVVAIGDGTFEDLGLALQNSFGITISFADPSLRQCRVTITYHKQDGLRSILEALQLIYHIQFEIKQKEVILSGKGCQ